jgi:DNA-directed RNA polymerase subunit RPC12/RpoP
MFNQPQMINLTCPSCGGKVTVTQGTMRYKCEYCGNEFIIPQTTPQPEYQSTQRPRVPKPDDISIERDGQAVRLVRRWFTWTLIPAAFFCVAWDSFLFFWYGMAFSGKAPWIMIVFPIAHVAVGIGLTYSTLAGLLNRTYIEIDANEMAIWHDPLPWTGETKVPVREIAQLYCTEVRGSKGTSTYRLFMETSDGRSKKLLSNLTSPDTGLFLEQQIESWLHITDVPVPGELPR